MDRSMNDTLLITESGKELTAEWVMHADLEVVQTTDDGRVVAYRMPDGELAVHVDHVEEVSEATKVALEEVE